MHDNKLDLHGSTYVCDLACYYVNTSDGHHAKPPYLVAQRL